MTALFIFACGALYEAACVGFVHYSERQQPLPTALCSMATAASVVTGILGSVNDWHYAPFFVLGHGVGAYLAVRLKRRTTP